jgi:hypothetical protein
MLSVEQAVPQDFVRLAHDLADAAGLITSQYFRSSRLNVDSKCDASPVTIADQQAEAAMRSLITAAQPSHSVFGEEAGLSRGASSGSGGGDAWLWVLDPIDGTKSFITGVVGAWCGAVCCCVLWRVLCLVAQLMHTPSLLLLRVPITTTPPPTPQPTARQAAVWHAHLPPAQRHPRAGHHRPAHHARALGRPHGSTQVRGVAWRGRGLWAGCRAAVTLLPAAPKCPHSQRASLPLLVLPWLQRARSTLNGRPIATRPCGDISNAYLYATTPHMFAGPTEQVRGRCGVAAVCGFLAALEPCYTRTASALWGWSSVPHKRIHCCARAPTHPARQLDFPACTSTHVAGELYSSGTLVSVATGHCCPCPPAASVSDT